MKTKQDKPIREFEVARAHSPAEQPQGEIDPLDDLQTTLDYIAVLEQERDQLRARLVNESAERCQAELKRDQARAQVAELLAALKWLKNTFDFAVPPQNMRESYRPAYREAIRAIAAAEKEGS